jgi:hypothetical protein
MAGKAKDLEDKQFGRLTVCSRHIAPGLKGAYWNVRCTCGTEKVIRGSQLTTGGTVSCGCYAKENPPGRQHGMTGSFEHNCWLAMRRRCYNTNHKAYPQYGGRGIGVCESWQDFTKFYEDMGPCPFPKGSVERVDVDGNYTPTNCVWLPKKLQSANRRIVKAAQVRHETLTRRVAGLYELVGWLYIELSGTAHHASECAVYKAPASLPGPCDCRVASYASKN